jgi:hypothetical protein
MELLLSSTAVVYRQLHSVSMMTTSEVSTYMNAVRV